MRFILKAAVVLCVTVLFLLVAGYVVLRNVDLDHYKSLIAHSVESATGRELVIGGDIRVRPSLAPAIVVEDIEFRNPGFATQPNMVTVGRLEGQLELLPLLRGQLVINRIRLIEPTLVLELARGDMRNWRFHKGAGGAVPAAHIQQAAIRDGRITYLNSDTGNRVDFFIHEAQAHLRAGSDVIQVSGRGGWKFREWQDVTLDVEGSLGSLASFFDDTPTEIDVTGKTDDVAWHVTGSVGDVLRASGVDLQVHGTTESLAHAASFTPFPLPDLGSVVATARVTGDRPSYDVHDIDAQLHSDAYQARATGSIDALVIANRVELAVTATATSAVQALSAFGLEWPLDGTVTTQLRVAGDNQTGYGLPNVDIALRADALRSNLTGSVAQIPGLQGLALDATLWAARLGAFTPVIDRELPAFGPVTATARLSRDTEGLAVHDLEAQLTDDRIDASATGTVGDALTVRDVALDVAIAADRLSSLSDLAGWKLPDLGAVQLEAALIRGDDAFRVESLTGSLNGKSVDASIRGLVNDLRGFEGLDLGYDLRVDSLGSLSELVGAALPETDPLSSTGHLYYEGLTSHRVHLDSDLQGTDFNAKIAGTVADVIRWRDARATVQLDAITLDELSRVVQRDLPPWGPLKMAGTLRHDATTDSPTRVEAVFTSGRTSARVEGSLDTTTDGGAADLHFDISTDTLASLSRFVDKDLPDAAPLRAIGRVQSTDAGYRFEDLDIRAGESDIKGRLTWLRKNPGGSVAGDRARLTGELVAERVDLRPWLGGPDEKRPEPASPFVFSPEPFDLHIIRDYDVELAIRIGQLRFRLSKLRDVRLNYKALNGLLELPVTATLNPGEINAHLVMDATRTPVPIELRLYANDVDTEQISALPDDGLFQEGNININMELSGSGNSVREWLATTDGHVLLVINRGKISQPALRLIGADILWQVANIVNPFTQKRDFLELECGVMGFLVRDGIARSDRWIATQSREVTVLGAGVVDLGSEDVQIALRPKAREGIGISASSLVKLVRVGGTLKDLKPEADPSGLLQSGASIGAAVFSGGLTVLAQGLYDRVMANQEVCETTHRSFIGSLTDPDAGARDPARGKIQIMTDK